MSKRKDFEAALVDHLIAMMSWVAKKHGGVNEILNDLIFTEDNPEHINNEASMIFYDKSLINNELSSSMLRVEIYNVQLDVNLQPTWTYAVHFRIDQELGNAWYIKRMLIEIDEANLSYEILKYFIANIKKVRLPLKANDPLWDYFKTLVNGETYLKTMEFSKQSQL